MTPFAAYLRVYEPLVAFAEPERRHWEACARDGSAVPRETGPERERDEGLALVAPTTRLPEPEADGGRAHIAVVDGVTLVCPLQTDVRSWQAVVDFREGLPDALADAFLPATLAEEAAARLAAWQREEASPRVHVQTATWQVPLRWFVLVAAEERRLVLGRRRGDRERSLLYRTPMVQARRRVARALVALRRLDDAPAVAGLEDLGRWLEEFHPRSLVELDYGGLVRLLDDDRLRADESARDVGEALARLAEGDPVSAAAAYERVVARWRAVAALESAN